MANIDELKDLVAAWQKIEDDGGSPTSAGKLAGAKAALAEAEAAAKPAKKSNQEFKQSLDQSVDKPYSLQSDVQQDTFNNQRPNNSSGASRRNN